MSTDAAEREQPDDSPEAIALRRVLAGLHELRDGNFRRRMPETGCGIEREVAEAFNTLAERHQHWVRGLFELRDGVAGSQWNTATVASIGVPDGGWALAAEAINTTVQELRTPVAELGGVLTAVAEGDTARRISLSGLAGPGAEFAGIVNELLDQLGALVDGTRRLTHEVGVEGRLGGRIDVLGLRGTWRELAEAINAMAAQFASEVRDFSRVAKAVSRGDLHTKVTVATSGEPRELKTVMNTMVDQLAAFAAEVVRLAQEVSEEGRLGGRAEVPDAAGTWREAVEAVNVMAENLTNQVRDISQVASAVAGGDLTRRIDVDARGEILRVKNTINTMVDQLAAFAEEVTRVAREVGTEGRLGGQARVPGVAGTWRDLTDKVNTMADNLTNQVRGIAAVASAVADGDLSKKITVEAAGEIAALADTINQMVDTLRAFAEQVTLVAREVGTEGVLGGQARVPGVAGTWKDLTDNVNLMARNLTAQVRDIAQVTKAVAAGDLSKKIDVDARGEILDLKTTVNTMVDRLSAFAAEVTRVAREVGTEGKLGGQAEVVGASGTWQQLTERVNHLAGNLTTQVRAIAAVATAVTEGDLTRQVTVDASGEVADLKTNINRMIDNLKATTRANEEQDWLKTHFAHLSGMLQGEHNPTDLADRLLSELAPLVGAQYGAFFLARGETSDETVLERTATYGLHPTGADGSPTSFQLGESLVGQAARDQRTVRIDAVPEHYAHVSSALGSAAPRSVLVLPIEFEGHTLGVLELGSLAEFSHVHRDLLERLRVAVGATLTTILANARTEHLLRESQHLTSELRARSEQLQEQQQELKRSNAELADKAALLASRNRDIEIKTSQIEHARQELEERAGQLSVASRYKSEFLANMSHELRTPLNSALLLAKLLGDNAEGNLTGEQLRMIGTIHSAGTDLLQLINDVLDLSKVEAGRMDVVPGEVVLTELAEHVRALYEPLATERGLDFAVHLDDDLPDTMCTDEHRLEQVLRNLLSNAMKFTERGGVQLRLRRSRDEERSGTATGDHLAFEVRDTGIGIPGDQLAAIFEAFQQVDGTEVRAYGGTGLGLSISRELTALLDGQLRVDSEPGRGSTFTLHLPRSGPDVVTEAGERPALESGEHHPVPDRFDDRTVLLIDDDQRGVAALAALLRRHGIEVLHAEDGMAGLALLREHDEVDAVLVDLMMPRLDGASTVAAIREQPRWQALPVITITAKALHDEQELPARAEADAHLTKPVDTDHLLRLLARAWGEGDSESGGAES